MRLSDLCTGTDLWIKPGDGCYKIYYRQAGTDSLVYETRSLTHVEIFIDGFKAGRKA